MPFPQKILTLASSPRAASLRDPSGEVFQRFTSSRAAGPLLGELLIARSPSDKILSRSCRCFVRRSTCRWVAASKSCWRRGVFSSSATALLIAS